MLTKQRGIALAALLAGCGDDAEAGSASLAIKISGEAAAESGYPAGAGDERIAFADGWTLEFSHVVVRVTVATDDDDSGAIVVTCRSGTQPG